MAEYTRGQIWWVSPEVMADPPIGEELDFKQARPAVIISSDAFSRQGVRVVIPLSSWQDKFSRVTFHYRIDADTTNNLANDSSAVVLQVRSVSLTRFDSYIGRLTAAQMEEITAILGLVVNAHFS